MIRVVCGCGRVFKAEDRHTGKQTRCPACGAELIIGTPMSGSLGSGEQRLIEEFPSWWSIQADAAETNEDEARSTTVLEDGLGITAGSTPGLRDIPRAPARPPSGAGRSDQTVAAALGAGVLLAIAVLGWSRWETHGPGQAGPTQQPAPSENHPFSRVDRLQTDNLPPPGTAEGRRSNHPPRRLRLLVPAYFYPKGDGLAQWRKIFNAADRVEVVAIVNPSNGPGAERNPDYMALLAEAESRSARLVGYVHTQFAVRTTAEVKADIDAWLHFYPHISGFFIDQQPVDRRHSAYIADIARYAREKLPNALILSDPGTLCDEAYLARQAADRICIFYNHEGFEQFELPPHLAAYDSSHFAALIYQVADEKTMQTFLREAIVKRIGSIYITDGKTVSDPGKSNPWATLPSYWDAEVQTIAQLQ